jgi:HSP20 family protein
MDPSSFFGSTRRHQATVNIIDNASHDDIEIEAPGYKKEDVSIKLDDYTLIVEGTRGNQNEETKNDDSSASTRKFLRREFGAEHFKRSFNLPKSVDLEKIDAK